MENRLFNIPINDIGELPEQRYLTGTLSADKAPFRNDGLVNSLKNRAVVIRIISNKIS
jgi:hypothetical protein